MLAYLEGRAERSPSGCLLWQGAIHKKSGAGAAGYGDRTWPVPALAYRLRHGPPPAGMKVISRCGNPLCFEDTHTFAGTAKEVLQTTGLKGELHGRSKLSEANVRAIRADDRNLNLMAYEYGVSVTTIQHIRKRVTWKHLD